jgi:predicted transcriptional regulator
MNAPNQHRERVLRVKSADSAAESILKALNSEPRRRILDLLSDRILNVSEIAEALGMPMSTATQHINVLEEAKLLNAELQPAVRGLQKVCARAFDVIVIDLPRGETQSQQIVEISMPVGGFVDCAVTPTCGLASEDGIIGLFDDPASFYEPDRIQAQLLWFHHGYVEYRFPNRLPPRAVPDTLSLSLELCSEAPLHHKDWPSDITVWINGIEIGTWTSPADFGGQRGVLTPDWWESWNSQYGQLKVWQVNGEGTKVDGLAISEVRLENLSVTDHPFVSVRIGVKPDAVHVGGLNIFGRHFGNYPQDLILRIRYH